MTSRLRRIALAGGICGFSALGVLLAGGCGGSTSTATPADATFDANFVIFPDAPASDDASDDSEAPDAPIVPSDGGHCSPVNGACDVVLNNCPSMNGVPAECIPGFDLDSSTCVTERPSQHLPLGHTCCPTGDVNTEPCLPGTECFGDPCTDAGPPTARCTPRCCDDSVCGKSVPEGIVGSCSLEIVDDNQDVLYSVCTYERPCRPFGVTPCPDGQICIVTDKLGTATCSPEYLPDEDAGNFGNENDTCNASNSCADGLDCVIFTIPVDGGEPDASVDQGFCVYNCVVPGTTPPFDAGATGAPGLGGCPAGEVCTSFDPDHAPAWLGICLTQ